MASKSNKAFSLLEVLITVAILSTAIVFVFRAFTTVLSSVRFSQNITLACLLAEDKLWEIEEKQKQSQDPIGSESGTEKIQNQDFLWSYTTSKLADYDLIELNLTVNNINFVTYLLPKK